MHPPAAEEGQERRVQVDHRYAAKAHKKDRSEDVIESGQDDELRADTGDRRSHRLMRSRTILIRPDGEYRARHARERGPLQGGHAGVVRDDDRDTSIERAGGACVEDRLQIRSAPRYEDRDWHRHPKITLRPDECGTTSPSATAPGTARSAAPTASAGIATTRPIPMFHVSNCSISSTSPSRARSEKMAGTSQAARSIEAAVPSGNDRGRLPSHPPPVRWAIEWISATSRRARNSARYKRCAASSEAPRVAPPSSSRGTRSTSRSDALRSCMARRAHISRASE